ncbi:MAG: hypothetical protein KatS3mg104_0361 [Phycisphaerae bacterium]|nr:MAG: hypothetical protein KatS3mg104_0361 [Phycisphaerae bacterium]
MYATLILLLCAISAVQLLRSAGTDSTSWLLEGFYFLAGTLLIRQLGLPRLRSARPWVRNTLVWALLGSGYAMLLRDSWPLIGTLVLEEWIILSLLGLAFIRFVHHDGSGNFQQIALISVIIVVFALPGVDGTFRLLLITSLSVCGSLWLITSASGINGRWTLLYSGCTILLITGACLWIHWLIQPQDTALRYAAWVPSSGGDTAGTPNAKRGKGDGPDEVLSESGDSIGFDLGNTFSESGRDGLYDLWLESYGQPLEPSESQKMVGLKPSEVRVVLGKDREDLRVGRTFELRRKTPSRPENSRLEHSSSARVWVKGPMPVYIPLCVFSNYDGSKWEEMEHGRPSVPVRRTADNWMELLHPPVSLSLDPHPTEYDIRVGNLGGNILPLPGLVERFRMGRVNRGDFFASTRSGLIRLSTRQLLAGATLQAVCRQRNPSTVFEVPPALARHAVPQMLDTGPVDNVVHRIAEEWGRDRQKGWDQITKVLNRLRAHVVLDKEETVSPASESVRELLTLKRRGPDYQIASAAVILLRSLGYPTRLVSGLYASERDVNPTSGFAELGSEHVHFWIEIQLADGTWMTVDPSPGYPMWNLPMSVGQWFAEQWSFLRDGITTYPVTVAGSTGVLLIGWFSRRHLMNQIATWVCWARGNRVQDVWRVLELRSRLAGCPRAPFVTPGRWLGCLSSDPDTLRYVRHLNQALYNGAAELDPNTTESANNILSFMTLRWFIQKRKEFKR